MDPKNTSAKPADVQPEVIPEEYEDDQNMGEQDGQEEGGGAMRFTSPEASAERLSKMPETVHTSLQLMSEENIFNAVINEIQARCQKCREKCSVYDFEKMWTHMVKTYCMSFRSQYFTRNSRATILDQIPEAVMQYMKNMTLVELLQMVVDLAQQRGYRAKQRLDSFFDQDKLTVSQQEYDRAKEKCNYFYHCYHNYVDLFRLCTGSWRPQRPMRNRHETYASPNQNASYQERPIPERNVQHRRTDNAPTRNVTHDPSWRGQKYMTPTQQKQQYQQGRRTYQPGSYQSYHLEGRQNSQTGGFRSRTNY